MEIKITATELAKGLSDILNRVRYGGESFAVERNGERVAVIAPSGTTSPVAWRDVAARRHGLDLPGDGFADDLEVVQASQPRAEAPSWRD